MRVRRVSCGAEWGVLFVVCVRGWEAVGVGEEGCFVGGLVLVIERYCDRLRLEILR